MQVVVIVFVAIFVVVMGVAVTNFVTDAARAVLYHMHKMMVGKKFQRAEYHRLVDAQESVFEFDERQRFFGLQHRPCHEDAVCCGADFGGGEEIVDRGVHDLGYKVALGMFPMQMYKIFPLSFLSNSLYLSPNLKK